MAAAWERDYGRCMPMLHSCAAPGCATGTLSVYCFDHKLTRRHAAKSRLGNVAHPSSQKSPSFGSRDDPAFEAWLESSRGFRVIGPSGSVGVVRGHRYESGGALEALVVRVGILRRRTIELDPGEVAWVLPGARRLLLEERWQG